MTIHQSDLELLLQKQASQFLMRSGGQNEGAIQNYIVVDFEYAYDRSRYDGYATAEGAAAARKPRWPFHRIAAVSWQIMRFRPGEDVPSFDPPVVLSKRTHSEVEMVQRFFAAVAAEPHAVLVTWGGETKDLAVLRRVAAEYGMLLPRQIADLSPLSMHRIDLCNATAVRAETVHLPEYAAACSIPAKPSPSKSIGKLVETGDWDKVEEQVLADVLTTAAILVPHLVSRGVVGCNSAETMLALARTVTAAIPESTFAGRTFLPWTRGRQVRAGLKGAISSDF